MKQKGNVKRVKMPDFWMNVDDELVSEALKDKVYKEYYSRDSLYIYCDSSMYPDKGIMSVACSYVSNANIIVKQQLVYPSYQVSNKNIFGELKSIIYALTHLNNYLHLNCRTVQVYSDVKNIVPILNDEIQFKKHPLLKKTKRELINVYRQKNNEHKEIEITISYLEKEQRIFNPFMRSSHNAAKRILKSMR